MIALRDVHFAYPSGVKALSGVSVSVKEGEALLILGGNGSGKSTLLKLVAGLLRPQRGSIEVFGLDPSKVGARELPPLIGIIFQNPDHQLFSATALDEVLFGPRRAGLGPGEALARAEEALRALGLWEVRNRPPWSLSWGEKKRLCLAAALTMRPRALALDEPTMGQDPLFRRALLGLICKQLGLGRTLLIATHDMDFAWALGGRALIMKAGTVLAQGPAQELLGNGSLLAEAGLRPPSLVALWENLGRPTPAPFATREEALRCLRHEQDLP
jgi:energy-coupling factor transporter ATP-binding protein EcfA2